MNINEFIKELKKLNIIVTDEQLIKLERYYELLNLWNKKFNLTAITKKEDAYLKHFYDSLCLNKTNLLNNYKNLCDIGTGAGFPGVIISIFYPKMNITLLESNKKKCKFLEEVVNILNLKNVTIINDRAELYAKKNIEKYDLVTCRAVSSLKILIEYSAPLLKLNGYFIPLKGNVEEELIDTKNSLKKVGLKLEKIENYKLPYENSERNILIIKKINKTETRYPREYKQIIKNPL